MTLIGTMSLSEIISNELEKDSSGVWKLKAADQFAYSDGVASERYLAHVLTRAKDLRSASPEIEAYIKDWPSEYHLTRKRAQLLKGFAFDSTKKVLEVGCGCGAITRYLGEVFKQVVAVEGSIARAKLAQLRCADLTSVSIVSAPFQKLQFKEKFDIIFCIGVYEYSAAFVEAEDPYTHVLEIFKSLLNPGGQLVIAIENQFGLKYFAGSREDHVHRFFEGIEGYPRSHGRVRTFGRNELKQRLLKHFSAVTFFYPFPDYKIPDAVFSEDFLCSGFAGELLAQYQSQDHGGSWKVFFEEALAIPELEKNNMLPFFANSFLVFASVESTSAAIATNQLGCLYSANRRPEFRTETKIVSNDEGSITVRKYTSRKHESIEIDRLTLRSTESKWLPGISLQAQLLQRAYQQIASLEQLYEPCAAWLAYLRSQAHAEHNRLMLPGSMIDCIWQNVYVADNEVNVIDEEWVWRESLPLEFIVLRSIFEFLLDLEKHARITPLLRKNNWHHAMLESAAAMGLSISRADMEYFISQEAEFQSLVCGIDQKLCARNLKLRLWNAGLYRRLQNTRRTFKRMKNRLTSKAGAILTRL